MGELWREMACDQTPTAIRLGRALCLTHDFVSLTSLRVSAASEANYFLTDEIVHRGGIQILTNTPKGLAGRAQTYSLLPLGEG